jgi:hypothetical protein
MLVRLQGTHNRSNLSLTDLRFFHPRTAPATRSDQFAGQSGAWPTGIAGFALVQGAIGAYLAGGILRKFGFINLSSVGFVTQGLSGWVGFAGFVSSKSCAAGNSGNAGYWDNFE